MANTPSDSTPQAAVKADGRSPIIIDLGKQRRKRVKNLRKGAGRLMDEVNCCLEELRSAGTLSSTAQPVVVIVRQKRRRRNGGLLPML